MESGGDTFSGSSQPKKLEDAGLDALASTGNADLDALLADTDKLLGQIGAASDKRAVWLDEWDNQPPDGSASFSPAPRQALNVPKRFQQVLDPTAALAAVEREELDSSFAPRLQALQARVGQPMAEVVEDLYPASGGDGHADNAPSSARKTAKADAAAQGRAEDTRPAKPYKRLRAWLRFLCVG